MLHTRTHPNLDVPGCKGCQYANVGFAPSAMPGRHPQAVEVTEREKRWDRDLPAYKELRAQGVQPKAIDGCADVAVQAESKWEVETGRVVDTATRRVVNDLTSVS